MVLVQDSAIFIDIVIYLLYIIHLQQSFEMRFAYFHVLRIAVYVHKSLSMWAWLFYLPGHLLPYLLFLQPLLAMNYVHKRNNKILMMHLSHHAQPIIHFGHFVLERIQYRSKGVMNSTGSDVYEICLQASTISLLIRYFQGQQINWPSPSFQKI